MRCLRDKASVHSTRIEVRRLTMLRTPTTPSNGRRPFLTGRSATLSELRRPEGSFLIFSSGAHAMKLRSLGGIPEFKGRRMTFASWPRPDRCSWIHSKLRVTYTRRLSKRRKHFPTELHSAFASQSCRRNSPPCMSREPCYKRPGWQVSVAPPRHPKQSSRD